MKHHRQPIMFNASEVGEYVFCAKAWQLKREGVQPRSPRLKAGTVHHTTHQAGLAWARRLRALGRLLFALLIASLLLWLLTRLQR